MYAHSPQEKEQQSKENQVQLEQTDTDAENSEDEQTGYEFTIGDAKIILPNDYGYEDSSNESIECYLLYLEPEKPTSKFLLVYYYVPFLVIYGGKYSEKTPKMLIITHFMLLIYVLLKVNAYLCGIIFAV